MKIINYEADNRQINI